MSIAHAGALDGMLDGMFVQATRAGSYESQSRFGVTGGSVTLRVPYRPLNVVSFDQPRASAGCAGIDMYGGSFSFINSQQLVAVFRQIVQGAVAALFKLAINSISGQLGSTMAEFGDAIRALNAAFKNSCQVGESLFTAVRTQDPSVLSSKADEIAGKFRTLRNKTGDLLGSILNGVFDSNHGVRDEDPDNPMLGNLTWRRIIRSGSLDMFQNSAGVNKALLAQMVMNVTGTTVYQTSASNTDGSCQADFSAVTGNTKICAKTNDEVSKGRLTFEMLIDPGTQLVSLCTNADINSEFACKEISKDATLRDQGFLGTRGYVNKMLFGDEKITSAAEATGGLVANLMADKAQPIGSDLRGQLEQFRTPVLRHLLVVQKDKQALQFVATRLAESMANDLALLLAESIIQVGRSSLSGKVNIMLPNDYIKGLDDFEAQINQARGSMQERLKHELAVFEFTGVMAKNLPGAVPAPASASLKR